MLENHKILLFVCLLVISKEFYSFVEAGTISATETPAAHFEPQVAILCEPGSGTGKGQVYHSQYMTEQGKWVTDVNSKGTCLKDKMDILEYCKKVYPKRDVTNIVEASHYLKVPNWCKVGHKKCKISRWVKPFRCLGLSDFKSGKGMDELGPVKTVENG